jgi:hypothetical protein
MTAKEFDYVLSFLDTMIRVENNVDIEDEPNENCCRYVSVLLKNGNLIRGVLYHMIQNYSNLFRTGTVVSIDNDNCSNLISLDDISGISFDKILKR